MFLTHHGRAVVASDFGVALPVVGDAVNPFSLFPRGPLVLNIVVVDEFFFQGVLLKNKWY